MMTPQLEAKARRGLPAALANTAMIEIDQLMAAQGLTLPADFRAHVESRTAGFIDAKLDAWLSAGVDAQGMLLLAGSFASGVIVERARTLNPHAVN